MTREEIELQDEREAVMRFADQPGQWVDVTPEDVKQRQAEEFKKFEAMMKSDKQDSAG